MTSTGCSSLTCRSCLGFSRKKSLIALLPRSLGVSSSQSYSRRPTMPFAIVANFSSLFLCLVRPALTFQPVSSSSAAIINYPAGCTLTLATGFLVSPACFVATELLGHGGHFDSLVIDGPGGDRSGVNSSLRSGPLFHVALPWRWIERKNSGHKLVQPLSSGPLTVRGEPLWSVLSFFFVGCVAVSRCACPSAADYSVGWSRACLCVRLGVCVPAASVSVAPPHRPDHEENMAKVEPIVFLRRPTCEPGGVSMGRSIWRIRLA